MKSQTVQGASWIATPACLLCPERQSQELNTFGLLIGLLILYHLQGCTEASCARSLQPSVHYFVQPPGTIGSIFDTCVFCAPEYWRYGCPAVEYSKSACNPAGSGCQPSAASAAASYIHVGESALFYRLSTPCLKATDLATKT